MAGEYDFLSPVDPLSQIPGAGNTQQQAATAVRRGYRIGSNSLGQPNQAISNTTGQTGRNVPIYTPLNSGVFDPSILDQAGAALSSDVTRMQGAANRQYIRNVEAGKGFLNTVQQGASGILEESERATDLLTGFGNELRGYGNETVEEIRKNAQSVDQDITGMRAAAGRASDYAAAGVRTGEEAVGAYDADAHNKIDALVAGMDRSTVNSLAMIEKGQSPDGLPLSVSEKWQMRRDLTHDTGIQKATVVSQAWEQARNGLASLKMALANIKEQAGQTELGVGELRRKAGELRLEGGQQRLAAEATRQNYAQIRSAMMNLLVSGRASARALAAQMRVAGMNTYADMIYRNPESVVSVFAGLAQMASIASAPGGRGMVGVNLSGRTA